MERSRTPVTEPPAPATAAAPAVRRLAALPTEWRSALASAWRALWWSRLVVWAGGLAGLATLGRSGRWRDFDPGAVTAPSGGAADWLVAPAARWDAVWYLAIAHDGYRESRRAAFFPLYPPLVAAPALCRPRQRAVDRAGPGRARRVRRLSGPERCGPGGAVHRHGGVDARVRGPVCRRVGRRVGRVRRRPPAALRLPRARVLRGGRRGSVRDRGPEPDPVRVPRARPGRDGRRAAASAGRLRRLHGDRAGSAAVLSGRAAAADVV